MPSTMTSERSRRIARAWDQHDGRRVVNWWHSPLLTGYVDARIEAAGPVASELGANAPVIGGDLRGTAAALAASGQAPFAHGISVGCGRGSKELRLMGAGLVTRFSLWELSAARLEGVRVAARDADLLERVELNLGDAFEAEHPRFDLVHWDHSLHHMPDVDAAVAWSTQVLRPGGVLMINDYVGPTRLQWTYAEVRFARRALAELEQIAGVRARRLRQRTILDRWRMIWRDPSEAPQSDRILEACRRHCEGWAPRPIGCAMINILGPHATALPEHEAVSEALTRWDRRAEESGFAHFAFGVWRKPD